MWTSDEITIEIEEADASVMLVSVRTPAGTIEIMGVVALRDGLLTVDKAHIQGLAPGALRRSGLNAIGRKILEETGAKGLIVQGGTRATGRKLGSIPYPIRFPR